MRTVVLRYYCKAVYDKKRINQSLVPRTTSKVPVRCLLYPSVHPHTVNKLSSAKHSLRTVSIKHSACSPIVPPLTFSRTRRSPAHGPRQTRVDVSSSAAHAMARLMLSARAQVLTCTRFGIVPLPLPTAHTERSRPLYSSERETSRG